MKLNEFNKIDKMLSKYLLELVNIFKSPKEYFDNIQNSKLHFPISLIIYLLGYILLSIFNNRDSMLKGIFVVLISLIMAISTSSLSSIFANIEKNKRLGFIFDNSKICIFFMMVQFLLIWVYQNSEKYIWYVLSIIIIVLLQIWLFIYLPVRMSTNKRKICFNIITVFLLVGFFNYTLNRLINSPKVKRYDNKMNIVLLQDPVFTENINELGTIIKFMTYYLQTIESLTKYTCNDIIDGNNGALIILQCDKLLTTKDSLTKSYDKVIYNKTKSLYEPLFKITDNTQKIKDLYLLMIECNRKLNDFDKEEYKNIENDLQNQLKEANEFEIQLETRIKVANTKLVELKKKYDVGNRNRLLSEADKKELEKQIILIREEQDEIISMIDYFYNIQSLRMEENNEVMKKIEKDSIDLNIIKENTKLYSEINSLLQETYDSVEIELQKYHQLLNFYKIRMNLSMFMI